MMKILVVSPKFHPVIGGDEGDLRARADRFWQDQTEANQVADIQFQNTPGLHEATSRLYIEVCQHLNLK